MKNTWRQMLDQWNRFINWAKKTQQDMKGTQAPRPIAHRETTMNIKWNHVSGQWARFHEEAKERWSKLTDGELTAVNGRFEALTQKIQEKYGIEKDEAKTQIDLWTANLRI